MAKLVPGIYFIELSAYQTGPLDHWLEFRIGPASSSTAGKTAERLEGPIECRSYAKGKVTTLNGQWQMNDGDSEVSLSCPGAPELRGLLDEKRTSLEKDCKIPVDANGRLLGPFEHRQFEPAPKEDRDDREKKPNEG